MRGGCSTVLAFRVNARTLPELAPPEMYEVVTAPMRQSICEPASTLVNDDVAFASAVCAATVRNTASAGQ